MRNLISSVFLCKVKYDEIILKMKTTAKTSNDPKLIKKYDCAKQSATTAVHIKISNLF